MSGAKKMEVKEVWSAQALEALLREFGGAVEKVEKVFTPNGRRSWKVEVPVVVRTEHPFEVEARRLKAQSQGVEAAIQRSVAAITEYAEKRMRSVEQILESAETVQ